MSIGIDELFDMLSWNSDEDTQQRGIELAKQIKCYGVFLQPQGLEHGKDIWENCAKILSEYPDEILQYCLTELLEWLEDPNWPGGEIIFERLKTFIETDRLAQAISDCVKMAFGM